MPIWTPRSDYSPTGGPVAPSAAPGSIGGGWVDFTGSRWGYDGGTPNLLYSNSSGAFSAPWIDVALLRPSTDDPADFAQQLRQHFVFTAQLNYWFMFRTLNPGNSSTQAGYLIGLNGGTLVGFSYAAGTGLVGMTASGSPTQPTPAEGTGYYLIGNVVQTNGTTQTLTIQLFDTSDNPVGSLFSFVDTTAALRNLNGRCGIFRSRNSGSFGTTGNTSRLIYYDDLTGASTYTAPASPTTITLGASTTATITPDAPYTGTITGTPSGPAAAGLSAITKTFAGSATPQTANWTPTVDGDLTITWSNNGGLTNPSADTITVNPVDATGYTASASPNPVAPGGSVTISLALVGATVGASGVITPHASLAGGSFSPTSVSVNSGASTISSISYTAPNSPGTDALSFTHVGLGFSGDPTNISLVVSTPDGFLYADDTRFWSSPDVSILSGSGSLARVKSTQPGLETRATFTGSTFVKALIDTTFNSGCPTDSMPVYMYTVFDGTTESVETFIQPTTQGSLLQISLATGLDPGKVYTVRLWNVGSDVGQARWTSDIGLAHFAGFLIDGGGTYSTPASLPDHDLFIGDSIVEGIRVRQLDASTLADRDSTGTIAPLIARGMGVECAQLGNAGQAVAQDLSVPSMATTWKIQNSTMLRRLFSPPPKRVWIFGGTNDFTGTFATPNDITAASIAWLADIRATLPNALIYWGVPINGSHLTQIEAAVAARVSSGDPAVHVLDAPELVRTVPAGGNPTRFSFDGTHPNQKGHAYWCSDLIRQAQAIESGQGPVATGYSIVLPIDGRIGVASEAVIALTGGGPSLFPITITLSPLHVSAPSSVVIPAGSCHAPFAITPGQASYTITPTNDGGLVDPSPASGTATSLAATTYALDFGASVPVASERYVVVGRVPFGTAIGSDLKVTLGGSNVQYSSTQGGSPVPGVDMVISATTGVGMAYYVPTAIGVMSPTATNDGALLDPVVTPSEVISASGSMALASDGVDQIFLENGINLRQGLAAMLSILVGESSGMGTGELTFRAGGSSPIRVQATSDNRGNRFAVKLNLPE
jgi:lysophospholipase L1-like esterase